jgi:hypothetical protein
VLLLNDFDEHAFDESRVYLPLAAKIGEFFFEQVQA